jgi:hypothetical protein
VCLQQKGHVLGMAVTFEVTEVRYLNRYRIQLRFEDGSAGVADLSGYPNQNNVFRAFLDLEYFKRFRVQYGTLIWRNGEVDIAPETLYSLATNKPVTYRMIKSSAV